jgi:hypothetical protein
MRRNKDFIQACARPVKGSPIPSKFAMWTAISAIAGALGRKCWFSMPHYDIRPNLFIVLLGPPGTNKSVSLILPFSKVFSKLTTPVGTKEDDNEFNSGLTQYGLKDYPLYLIQDKITPERLAVEMNKITRWDERVGTVEDMFYDSSLTMVTSEFGTFMSKHYQYLHMFMTDMWDSKDSFSHQIKTGASQFIKGPCLNWIACATPQQFIEHLPEDAASQGLLSRFLPIYHQGERIPQSLLQERVSDDTLKDLRYDLSLIASINGRFGFDEEAKEVAEKDMKIFIPPESKDPNMSEYNQRRVSHFLKVAMSINASRIGNRIITLSDWERTKEIMFDMEEKMPKALEGFGRSKTGKITHDMKEWLETTIFNNNRTHVPLKRFKRQLLNKTTAPSEMTQYLQAMQDTGYIRVEDELVFLCRKNVT